MAEELEHKYEVEVKKREGRQNCPVLESEAHFIQCFVCPNFQSRVMGSVLCKGDKL